MFEGQDPVSCPSGWRVSAGDGCTELGFWVSKKCTECPLSICKFDDRDKATEELRLLIKKGQVEAVDDIGGVEL